MNRFKRSSRICPDLASGWLEARIALSLGPNLSVASISPSNGSFLTAPPQNLVLTFDRPFDPYSVGFTDLLLDQVNSDGSLTPVFDPINGATEIPDSSGPNGSGLVITVPIGQTLVPGHYEVLMSALATVTGLDGSMTQSAIDGMDEPVANFTVTPPGVKLNQATDLGMLTAGAVSTTGGFLDLANNPYAVSLYKVEVPEGHFWRLGLSVDAARIGSSLTPQLTLFDAQGQRLTTVNSGRNDAPTDPYLFDGVGPGTYYVGISGHGNVGGSAGGGYDLVSGDPGSLGQPQSGGVFMLNAVADTADAPVSLIGFNTVHFDPLDSTPVGVSLQFSGPLGLGSDSATILGKANAGVEVVDASGHSWPVQLSGYDEANAKITYLFQDALPAGHYKIVIPDQGGLADLAGLTPVTHGLPSHVLATFAVSDRTDDDDARNLGTPSPDALSAGLDGHVEIPPGQTVTYRFVSAVDNFYQIGTTPVGGTVQVQVVEVSTGRTATLESGLPDQSSIQIAGMHPGVYLIRFTANGSHPVRLDWSITAPSTLADSILANGVGQGAALNLHLIAPGAVDSSSGSSPTPVAPANPSGPSSAPFPQPFTPGTSSATPSVSSTFAGPVGGRTEENNGSFGATAPGSAGLFLGVSGSLVGRPLEQSESVAAVGPGSGAAVASASFGGLGQAAGTPGRWNAAVGGKLGFGEDVGDPTLAANDETAQPDLSGSLKLPVLQASAETPTLPELGWLENLRAALGAGLPNPLGDAPPAGANSLGKEMIVDASVDPAGLRGDGSESHEFEHAGVSTPLVAGLVAVLVARSHHSLHSWFGKGKRVSIPLNVEPRVTTRV